MYNFPDILHSFSIRNKYTCDMHDCFDSFIDFKGMTTRLGFPFWAFGLGNRVH